MNSIAPFFEPTSVAVVGASANPRAAGGRLLRYLQRSFKGDIHPVNAGRDIVQGMPAVRSVDELPLGVDLAVVAVPAEDVLDVVRALGRRGVKSVVLFTAGFAEAGPAGARLQNEVVATAREYSMRLCGPNSLGFVNVAHGLYATFTSSVDPAPAGGSTAVVSQSGGFGAMFLSVATQVDLGVGFFCATGNESDVSVAEVIEYLVERPDVHAVVSFVEGIRDPEALDRAARRAAVLDKPIAMAKVGSTPAGAAAALSHSAAVVGDDAVHDALFDELGIIRVRGLDGMLDAARIFANGRRSAGRNLGIVTASGGGGVLLADAAVDAGLRVPMFEACDRERIEQHIPAFGASRNPVDTTAQVTAHPEHFADVLVEVADLELVDVLMAFLGPLDHVAEDLVRAVRDVMSRTDKPVVVVWGGGSARFKGELTRSGIPTFDDPDRAVRATGWLVRHSLSDVRNERSRSQHVAERRRAARNMLHAADAEVLLESEAKRLLALYDFPVVEEHVVRSASDAADVARLGSGPWVVKILSRDLPHKADVGGVRLGVDSTDLARVVDELRAHVQAIAPEANLDGVLVQRQLRVDHELVLGLTRDPRFGPVVGIGFGGRSVEIVREMALHRAPLVAEQAASTLAKVFDGRLSSHPRGLDEGQRVQMGRLLVQLGDLALELPEVVELDLNPVVLGPDGVALVDALVRVEKRSA